MTIKIFSFLYTYIINNDVFKVWNFFVKRSLDTDMFSNQIWKWRSIIIKTTGKNYFICPSNSVVHGSKIIQR